MPRKRTKPISVKFYNPQEAPTMYPLELTPDYHICLWDSRGDHKWTIAYLESGKEGPNLVFVGDRPLDRRVDWVWFKEIIKQAYKKMEKA